LIFDSQKVAEAAEAEKPQVTESLIELLKEGITWRGLATQDNPLTENGLSHVF
jgi:hypothetical protein